LIQRQGLRQGGKKFEKIEHMGISLLRLFSRKNYNRSEVMTDLHYFHGSLTSALNRNFAAKEHQNEDIGCEKPKGTASDFKKCHTKKIARPACVSMHHLKHSISVSKKKIQSFNECDTCTNKRRSLDGAVVVLSSLFMVNVAPPVQ
jgi:hypothetical protein